MKNIKLWGWEKKPRTMLRSVKVGDIVCFEIDSSRSKFGYGQIIARLTGGFAFKGFDITHDSPDKITVEEIENAEQLSNIFVLDVYATLDHKKYLQNGEWRVIGYEDDFKLSDSDFKSVFFQYGSKGMKKRKDLLNQDVSVTDIEAENYISSGPVSGDQAKMWYLKYDK